MEDLWELLVVFTGTAVWVIIAGFLVLGLCKVGVDMVLALFRWLI